MSRSTLKDLSTEGRKTFWTDINLSRPDGMRSRDGRFRWSSGWQKWIPLPQQVEEEIPLPGPLESGPLLPDHHSESCLCGECMTAGQHYADYLKARRLRDVNGF